MLNVELQTPLTFRYKIRGIRGNLDRTFLNSIIAQQVAADPPAYLVAVVPIPEHEKIGIKDEANALRAEVSRSFRITAAAPDVTILEQSYSVDIQARGSTIASKMVGIEAQMGDVLNTARYFQMVRPLSECGAEDGRVVGRMLIELVQKQPKYPAHAIRIFANRIAMLRECGFRHIGAMLARLLSVDARGGPDEDAIITAPNPSSVTETQATAIGSAIALGARRSRLPATVKSNAVLRAMKSEYVWFVPMLEVLTANFSDSPASWKKRLSSIVPAEEVDVKFTPIGVDEADAECGFSSEVPNAHAYLARSAGEGC